MNRHASEVVASVSAQSGATVSEIMGPSRSATVVRARRAIAMILRHNAGMSYPEIGRALGCRSHTTAWNLIVNYKADPYTERLIGTVCESLGIETPTQPARATPEGLDG
jgi:hypothetical protein